MAGRVRISRSFNLEGSRAELRCLMETIDEALKCSEKGSRPQLAQGKVGPLDIEVKVGTGAATLAVRPGSREEAAMLLDGWVENVKCAGCETPVALLFEEEYSESSSGRGAMCVDCMRAELDGESV